MAARYFHRKPTPAKPWYRRDNGARFAADTALIAENFSTLVFRIDEETELVFLEGPIAIRSDCGISTNIETRLIFPRNYPDVEPLAFDASKRFKPYPGKTIEDRHIYNTGQCCLWLPPQTSWRSSDPYALRDFLDQLVIFFDRQLIYNDTGVWPGPAWVAFPRQDGLDNRQSGETGDIGDDVVQLQVHLIESLLHVLNVSRSHLHQTVPMTEDRTHRVDLLIRPERSAQ